MSAVSAADLFRLYTSPEGTAVALQGLTLDVAEGEVVVVFGPSGSGKSTLVRILAGLDRPSAGTVRVFDHDLRTLRGRRLLEYRSRTLGYADQHYTRALAPELTARELVGLRLGLLGESPAARAQVADRLLERVGLSERAKFKPSTISGGERQRVVVARALVGHPAIVLADEPTGNLDSTTGASIMELIRELNAAGATIIMITHDTGLSDQLPRQIRVLDGQVVSDTGGDRDVLVTAARGELP